MDMLEAQAAGPPLPNTPLHKWAIRQAGMSAAQTYGLSYLLGTSTFGAPPLEALQTTGGATGDLLFV